jgi:hypothetical protein
LLEEDVDPFTVRGITRSYLFGPGAYLASTLMAFASPIASAVLFGALACFYMVESTVFAGWRRWRGLKQ